MRNKPAPLPGYDSERKLVSMLWKQLSSMLNPDASIFFNRSCLVNSGQRCLSVEKEVPLSGTVISITATLNITREADKCPL